MRWRHATGAAELAGVALILAFSIVVGCSSGPLPRGESPALESAGRAAEGREAAIVHGCGSCHRIEGVPNANSLVGPPLDSWSRRSFIAGTLPNTQANLERWLRDPQEVRPGSAMPTIELTEQEVADITAFLFTLD
jgi:cytochrome c1